MVEVGGKSQKRFEYVESGRHASVGVGVIVERNGTVLLQRRTGSHGEGTWSCPGGHIDFGETLEACARRETREETGLEIGAVTFHAITNDVFPDEDKHYVTVWVRAAYIGGEPEIRSEKEVNDVGWFPWDRLPEPLFIPLKNLVEGKEHTVPASVSVHARVS
ncbi:MAG: NUDIX domain-containing protein [bacterium]|nr:NUDIX domain-containing protein [bacterium]